MSVPCLNEASSVCQHKCDARRDDVIAFPRSMNDIPMRSCHFPLDCSDSVKVKSKQNVDSNSKKIVDFTCCKSSPCYGSTIYPFSGNSILRCNMADTIRSDISNHSISARPNVNRSLRFDSNDFLQTMKCDENPKNDYSTNDSTVNPALHAHLCQGLLCNCSHNHNFAVQLENSELTNLLASKAPKCNFLNFSTLKNFHLNILNDINNLKCKLEEFYLQFSHFNANSEVHTNNSDHNAVSLNEVKNPVKLAKHKD